jgi:hypothetical protein
MSRKRNRPHPDTLPLPFFADPHPQPGPGPEHRAASPVLTTNPLGTEERPDPNNPLLVEYHRAFYDNRKVFLDAELTASKSFDKTMTTLSAGALSLSLTFVAQLGNHRVASTVIWLKATWVLFGSALVFILLSFICSQYAWRQARDREDWAFQNEGQTPTGGNGWAKTTQVLNWFCLGFFILGVVALLWFSILNYSGEVRMAGTSDEAIGSGGGTVSKGSVPPKSTLPRPATSTPSPAPRPSPLPEGRDTSPGTGKTN